MEALQVGTLAPLVWSPHTQKEDAPKTDFKEAHIRGHLEDTAKSDPHRPPPTQIQDARSSSVIQHAS